MTDPEKAALVRPLKEMTEADRTALVRWISEVTDADKAAMVQGRGNATVFGSGEASVTIQGFTPDEVRELALAIVKRRIQKDCSVRLKMFQQTREQPSLRNASWMSARCSKRIRRRRKL